MDSWAWQIALGLHVAWGLLEVGGSAVQAVGRRRGGAGSWLAHALGAFAACTGAAGLLVRPWQLMPPATTARFIALHLAGTWAALTPPMFFASAFLGGPARRAASRRRRRGRAALVVLWTAALAAAAAMLLWAAAR
jgi:hypothetical protein